MSFEAGTASGLDYGFARRLRYPASAVLEKAPGQALYAQRPEDPEAGDRLGRAVKALPRDPEARHYYAQWAYLNGKDTLCIQQEEAAVALGGLNDLALLQMYTLLGMCRSRLPDAAATRAAFRKANAANLRGPPYDPVAAYQFVQFLGRLGDFEEQQSIVNEILAHAPRFGPAHVEWAKHLERNRHPAEAIESASLALRSGNMELNQERAAHMVLAKCHMTLGNTKEVESEQRWIEAHPNPETP